MGSRIFAPPSLHDGPWGGKSFSGRKVVGRKEGSECVTNPQTDAQFENQRSGTKNPGYFHTYPRHENPSSDVSRPVPLTGQGIIPDPWTNVGSIERLDVHVRSPPKPQRAGGRAVVLETRQKDVLFRVYGKAEGGAPTGLPNSAIVYTFRRHLSFRSGENLEF